MSHFDVDQGYGAWAATYDSVGNPLIGAESTLLPRLEWVGPQHTVLDAATGTGRHALRFASQGATVLGVDASRSMLEIAARKRGEGPTGKIAFVQARIDRPLPIRERCCDLAICALALCHVAELEDAVAAIGRTVKNGGTIALTDLHPASVSAGLGTVFEANGQVHSIATHAHSVDRYLAALEKTGSRILAVGEVTLGEVVDTRPDSLPTSVSSWRTLPFCLSIEARVVVGSTES